MLLMMVLRNNSVSVVGIKKQHGDMWKAGPWPCPPICGFEVRQPAFHASVLLRIMFRWGIEGKLAFNLGAHQLDCCKPECRVQQRRLILVSRRFWVDGTGLGR